jgi:hypothetical protein
VVRIRELLQPLGYTGGETILKRHVREVRPLFLRVRTYQRTVYLPGELPSAISGNLAARSRSASARRARDTS